MRKIIASLVVLSLAISVAGCNLFAKDPQQAVDDGMTNLAGVKKMNSSLVMSGTMKGLPGEKPQLVQFSVTAAGKTDTSQETSPIIDLTMSINATMDGQKMAGDVALRVVDKKIFAKVVKLEMPGAQGKAITDQLGSVLTTWWSLPIGEESSFSDFSKKQKEFQDVLKSAKFFTNAKEEGKETVQGVATVRYRVDLNKDAVKKFILDTIRISENQLTPEDENAIGEQLKDVEASGAVWVGDDDYILRVKGTITVQPKVGPSTSFEIDFTAGDYGKDIAVASPEGAQKFNPIMMIPLLGALSSIEPAAAVPGTDTGDLGAAQVKPAMPKK